MKQETLYQYSKRDNLPLRVNNIMYYKGLNKDHMRENYFRTIGESFCLFLQTCCT